MNKKITPEQKQKAVDATVAVIYNTTIKEMWVDLNTNVMLYVFKQMIMVMPHGTGKEFLKQWLSEWKDKIQNNLMTDAKKIYENATPKQIEKMIPKQVYTETMERCLVDIDTQIGNVFREILNPQLIKEVKLGGN